MKKILVTGGAGFIGSHVVESFLKQGNRVAVLDNLETGERKNLPTGYSEKLEFKELSILSRHAFDFICDYKPDTIVHLAAQMNVRRSVADPIYDVEQNILGTINILQAAKNISLSNFIFSSTGGAIYGEQDYFPADESHPIKPKCPYGLSKNCAELYIRYFSEDLRAINPNFKSAALRFGNVYGPRQNPKGEAGVVAIFSNKVLSGQDLLINGRGTQTRDFIFVGDVVDAIHEFYSSTNEVKEVFSVFNLGTGIETDINQIANEILRLAVEEFNKESVKVNHGPEAPGEQIRSLLDAGLFSSTFNWKPKIDISEGLKITLQSFLDNS